MQQTSANGRQNRRIEELGPWFHNVTLPDGTQTFPNHWLGDFPRFKWEQLAPHLPEDLSGWTVLDIGCNAGFYSFECAKRGAFVTGIDVGPHYLAQAEWLAHELGLADRLRFERMQVYDLARKTEQYDLVLFMGVFYHLRYPMLGLDVVCQKVRRMLVFQTLSMFGDQVAEAPYDVEFFDRDRLDGPGWPKMAFIENRMAGDPTNWWVANKACCEAMLRAAGMKVLGYPLEEGYLCEPDQNRAPVIQTWDRDEFLAASGQDWLPRLI